MFFMNAGLDCPIVASDPATDRYRRYTLELLSELTHRVELAASNTATAQDMESAGTACDTLKTFLGMLREQRLN